MNSTQQMGFIFMKSILEGEIDKLTKGFNESGIKVLDVERFTLLSDEKKKALLRQMDYTIVVFDFMMGCIHAYKDFIQKIRRDEDADGC